MTAGASHFLEKPYSDRALLASIEAALEKAMPRARSRCAEAVRRIGILSQRESRQPNFIRDVSVQPDHHVLDYPTS
jgi:FixJ family two-component response regulator